MKLLIFLSGACLGTVIGTLIGYQVIDDQLREKTQLKQAEQGHAHSKTTPPADPPTTNPKHQPDSVRKMLNKLQEYVRPITWILVLLMLN